MSTTLHHRGTLTLAIVTALAGCAPPPPPPPDLAAAEAEVRAASQGVAAAEAAKDAETALTYWASDAILHLAGSPMVEGTEGLRAGYGQMFSEEAGLAEFESTTTAVHVAPSGDVAWEHGVNRMVYSTPEGSMLDMGKYLAVWEKQAGAWKIVALAATSDAPQPVPAVADTASAPSM